MPFVCFFSHISPIAGRKTYADRARRLGTECYAENIGRGDTPQLIIRGWMFSGPHKRTILDPRYTTIGVGVAGKKCTTMFGVQKKSQEEKGQEDSK